MAHSLKLILAAFALLQQAQANNGSCVTPTSTTGYTNIVETDLSVDGFNVTVGACAGGYSGTAVVTACSTNASTYTLTGCTIPTCLTTTSTGYTNIVETTLTVAGFTVTAACASGYSGTAVAAVCSSSGSTYSLTGCTLNQTTATACSTPTSTTGYTSIVETDLTITGWNVTAACASGYSGTAVATACSALGSAYSLTGCTQPSTSNATVATTSGCHSVTAGLGLLAALLRFAA